MKKLLSLLFIITGCLLISSQAQAIENKSKIFNYLNGINNHAVSIVSVGENGMGACSGTVLKNSNNEAYILTAKHCVQTINDEIYVDNVLVISIQTSVSQDLALLKTNDSIPNKTTVKIASLNANIREELSGVGYPGVTEAYIIHGTVFIKGFNDHYGVLNIIPGCSGAGLFDSEGLLVGVVWGKTGKFGAYDPVTQIRKFLKEANYVE